MLNVIIISHHSYLVRLPAGRQAFFPPKADPPLADVSVMIIKEFLPNPPGKDTEGEYIILFNDGSEAVNLSGWSIKDLSGKTFRLSGVLEPNQELKLPYSTTKIALNNNGETLYLIDPSGGTVHELGYTGTAAEGRIVSQVIELSEEMRQELFEDVPENSLPIAPAIPLSQLLPFMILTAAILASLSIWIIKKTKVEIWREPQNQ